MTQLLEIDAVQDHADLVELWGDLIDWPSRLKMEGPFLVQHLKEHHAHRVFDACLGDGVDTVYLLKQGFSVISNEPDAAFRKKALRNARAHGVTLEITQYDWRNLDQYAPTPLFDAIYCLGNSFTYLFDKQERELVLRHYHSLLRPGGILMIDERNYPYMLANREKILHEGAPTSARQVIYCGKKVVARPKVIEESLVVMHYYHKETLEEGTLSFYPFKKDELRGLLEERFEYLGIFSDFAEGYDAEAGFYQHVCRKKF